MKLNLCFFNYERVTANPSIVYIKSFRVFLVNRKIKFFLLSSIVRTTSQERTTVQLMLFVYGRWVGESGYDKKKSVFFLIPRKPSDHFYECSHCVFYAIVFSV